MAEAAGIAGTAAGIVSLGIQLYSGISSYLEAIKGRKEDLAAVSRHLQSLRAAVRVLETAIPRLLTQHQAASDAVQHCLQNCNHQMKALEALFATLVDSPSLQSTSEPRGEASQTTSTPSGPSARVVAKLRDGKKKLSYPFERPKLEILEGRVRDVNATLKTAMLSLGLWVVPTNAKRGLIPLTSRSAKLRRLSRRQFLPSTPIPKIWVPTLQR